MKTVALLSIPFILFASGKTLTPSEHMSLHSSNHRPVMKLQKQRKMHQLHKINEKQAAQIVKELTQEEVTSIRLAHNSNYLLFKAKTPNYRLAINALDGTVMTKVQND